MANNSDNPSGTAFSGFSGGHDSVPGVGDVAPATTGAATTGTSTLGTNLPHVDPNNFQGTVHWGPAKQTSGPQVGQLPQGGGPTGSGAGSN